MTVFTFISTRLALLIVLCLTQVSLNMATSSATTPVLPHNTLLGMVLVFQLVAILSSKVSYKADYTATILV